MTPTEASEQALKICQLAPVMPVLVIDDEEKVLKTIQMLVERLGYRVLGARTGKEALFIAQHYEETIDLALLDIKLSDMEGGEQQPVTKPGKPAPGPPPPGPAESVSARARRASRRSASPSASPMAAWTMNRPSPVPRIFSSLRRMR